MSYLKFLPYWAGLASITYGAWLIYRPLGFIIGGLLALVISFLLDKSAK